MESAKQNNVESMRSQLAAQPLLLDCAQSGIGNTAMHWAAARSSEQALQLLLEMRASTSVKNSSGSTPLHSAVSPSFITLLSPQAAEIDASFALVLSF